MSNKYLEKIASEHPNVNPDNWQGPIVGNTVFGATAGLLGGAAGAAIGRAPILKGMARGAAGGGAAGALWGSGIYAHRQLTKKTERS
jgi:hypothetical protein